MYRNYFLPASLLAGFIIGAGIFSLPYVFEVSGLTLGFLYLGLGALLYTLLHLMYADVVLRTSGDHEFVGFVRIYLGWFASLVAVFIAVIEIIVVLTIYLILSASFSNLIFPNTSPTLGIIIFWALGSAALYLSLRRIATLEFFILAGILAVIAFIFAFGIPEFSALHFGFTDKLRDVALPLSPILFALGGRVAVLSVVNYYGRKREEASRIKKAIIWGTIIPAFVYALFVLAVVALSSPASEDSISGLRLVLPTWSLPIIGLLGLLSLWSSYVMAGFSVKNILRDDLKLPSIIGACIIFFVPLALYFGGVTGFLTLISLVGGVFLALEGMFLIAMWIRTKQVSGTAPVLFRSMSSVTLVLLFIILAVAFGYEIMNLLT